MELVELLDKIDETAPKGCKTCRHMATHSHCDGCLDGGSRQLVNGSWEYTFPYRHWEPGNWLRDLQEAENAGRRNIVIGDQGEAEVNTQRTPKETAKELHRVAECCGYFVGHLRHGHNGLDSMGDTQIDVYLPHGEFMVCWKGGKLLTIHRMGRENNKTFPETIWPRF